MTMATIDAEDEFEGRQRSGLLIVGGVALIGLAVLLPLGVGALLTWGPKTLTFQAQEILGGTLSFVAVGMVTWMIFWMARSARSLSGDLKSHVDRAADASRASLVVVAMLAVGREGLETALFLWAATQAASSGEGSSSAPLIGAGLGLLTAVVIACLLYRGALSLNLSKFFTWTGAFLILVAAGVLAYDGIDQPAADGFEKRFSDSFAEVQEALDSGRPADLLDRWARASQAVSQGS